MGKEKQEDREGSGNWINGIFLICLQQKLEDWQLTETVNSAVRSRMQRPMGISGQSIAGVEVLTCTLF